MEKELKIVLSVFLVFFVFALMTFFNSGTFLAPFFLNKPVMVVVALIIALINTRPIAFIFDNRNEVVDLPEKNFGSTPKVFVPWLYFIATLFFAITDDVTIQLLNHWSGNLFFDQLALSPFFLWFSFIFYIGFYAFSIVLFYQSLGKPVMAGFLFILLAGFVFALFLDLTVLRQVFIHLFFIAFFVAAQGGSNLKNKSLRLIAYQYLLIPLLQSFEYFI